MRLSRTESVTWFTPESRSRPLNWAIRLLSEGEVERAVKLNPMSASAAASAKALLLGGARKGFLRPAGASFAAGVRLTAYSCPRQVTAVGFLKQ